MQYCDTHDSCIFFIVIIYNLVCGLCISNIYSR
nr:MAG TPA: hypothetical protein [Caudoviricetes sp.]DAU69255.1 MAG TPA: hypothetical protein [Bacteriophage sp.]